MDRIKVKDLLVPLQSRNNLTEEYAYNHQGIYPVIDGSTQDLEYKNKIDSFDYNCTCIAITTVGFYAGHVSKYSGQFSIGNNVQCYTINPKYSYDIDYVIFKLFQISKNILNGQSGEYSSLNITKFENSVIILDSPEYQEKVIRIMNGRDKLMFLEKKLTDYINTLELHSLQTDKQNRIPISKVIDLEGGSSYLTEEYLYNHSDNLDDLIKVYTGALTFNNKFVNRSSAKKVFKDTLKITRKGQAGLLSFIKGEFTINDDAYSVKILPEYENKVNMYYLYFYLLTITKEAVTSEGGNGTFNKNKFLKLNLVLPNLEKQNEIGKLIERYIRIKDFVESLKLFRIYLNQNLYNVNN